MKKYQEEHRYYHNADHIHHMLMYAFAYRDILSQTEYDLLRVAIEYHDIVYEPMAVDNEEKSFEYFLEQKGNEYNNDEKEIIRGLIMATKSPFEPKNDLEKLMVYIDWSHFMGNPKQLDSVNKKIFKEFKMVPWKKYVEGRDKFLNVTAKAVPDKLLCKYVPQDKIDKIKKGIELSYDLSNAFRPKIGIYVGSFNPLHEGHEHVIDKAEKLLDKVIVIKAGNASKSNNAVYDLPERFKRYYESYTVPTNKSIVDIVDDCYDTTADFFIIRGIRNGFDLTEEQNYMKILKDLGLHKFPVLHVLCDIEFQHISSSAIRSLESVGISKYYEK